MAGLFPDDFLPEKGAALPDFHDTEIDIPSPKKGNNSYKTEKGWRVTLNEDGSAEIDTEPQNEADKAGAMQHDANLAEFMAPADLAALAETLLREIDADLLSRRQFELICAKAIDYMGLKMETGGAADDNGSISKVYHTLLIESVVRYQSNASAEMLPSGGPVKVKDDQTPDAAGDLLAQNPAPQPGMPGAMPPGPGPQQGGMPMPSQPGMPPAPPGVIPGQAPMGMAAPQAMPPPGPGLSPMLGHNGGPPLENGLPPLDRGLLAEALELDMNHYLTVVAKEYYPDYYRMLFYQGLLGTAFKKIYKCPLRRRPVSDFISPLDLIVSNDATDLYTAGRVTHRTKMRQNIMKRMQHLKVYMDVNLQTPAESPTITEQKIKAVEGVQPTSANTSEPEDLEHELYETYTERDLAGFEHEDGLPLPYRITLEKTSRKILEIRRNWKEGDENYDPHRRFVKYGLIPGMGFYDYGFMHLLGNTTRALTAIERMLIDAGMFSSFPGFMIAKGGTRQTSMNMRVLPGTGKEIDTGGLPLKDVIGEIPYKEPSAVLAQFAQTIAQDARNLSGFVEIPVGEGTADIPVGTIMAMIEQSTKVAAAVHKRNHAAHREELELLRDLFLEDPESLWKFAKTPQKKWQVAAEFSDLRLVPASDPNIPSNIHRIMIGTAIAQRSDSHPGLYNAREVEEYILRILGVQNINKLLPPGPPPGAMGPPPNPEADNIKLSAAARAQEQAKELQATQMDGQIKIVTKQMDAAIKQTDAQTKLQIAGLNFKREAMKNTTTVAGHAAEAAQAHADHRASLLDKAHDLFGPQPEPSKSGG